jgi:diaminopimelate epimerase
MTRPFRWLKGHGSENDFVLLPDPDGTVHAGLDAELVRRLCHRRRGIGADGVLRVIRSRAYDDPAAREATDAGAEWFMDYRNADGSLTQMCGNGLRVFALHLAQAGLINASRPVRVGTRAGTRTVRFHAGDRITVDMGTPHVGGEVKVAVGARTWPAVSVDLGNPHAVAFVDDLAEVGPLAQPPAYDTADFPDGVNVEFAVHRGPGRLGLRVHERGVGETRSCGTGACAAAVAAALVQHRPAAYEVDMPGGRLHVLWRDDGNVELSGGARIVARGEFTA